jgi:hypothetical protein
MAKEKESIVPALIGVLGAGVSVGIIFATCASNEVKQELNSQCKDVLKSTRKFVDVFSAKAEKAYKENVKEEVDEDDLNEQWENVVRGVEPAAE